MSHGHDDFEKEPIPGLPARLPEGEHILWQGSPDAKAFLRSVLSIRLICGYFALVLVWNIGTALYDGKNPAEITIAALWTLVLAGVVYGMGYWFAKAAERTTIYTITNKRVVMRFGIAIPVTFNLPFSQIESADMKVLNDASGTLSLSLKEHTKISWPILWPHARPWKLAKPQPSLRAVAHVEGPAHILANALRAAHGQAAQAKATVAQPAKPQRSYDRPGNTVGAMPAHSA